MAFPEPAAPKSALGYRRILSPTSGLRISPLCLGGMSLGAKGAAHLGNITKDEAFALLDEFVAQGGNFIDVAPGYHQGESEEWIGEWMELRGNRDKIILATKYSSPNGTSTDVNQRGNSYKNMVLTVRDCLKRLRTDYIDIFYIHFWEHTTSVEEVMRGLHRFVLGGQILYPAVSDVPAWLIVKANSYANFHGLSPFVLYQGKYSLIARDLEREILPMCRDQGMGLALWGTIGGGKFQTKEAIAEREKNGEIVRGGGQGENDIKISAALEKVAGEVGASLTAVALAWAIQKHPYLFPIIGGRKISHLHDNIKGLTLDLSSAQIAELEAVLPFDFGFPFNVFGTDPATSGGKETNLVLKGSDKIFHVEAPKTPKLPSV